MFRRPAVAAFILTGVLTAGMIVSSGRAAGPGFHWPESLRKAFATRTTQASSQEPRTFKSEVRPLAPLASRTWNNSGTDFNAAGPWGGTALVTGDTAVFNVAEGTQPNLSASISLALLNFQAAGAGYDITATSPFKLTLTATAAGAATSALSGQNTTGTNTLDAPIVLGASSASTQTFNQSGNGGNLTINGVISSTNSPTLSHTMTGTSTLTIAGSNTYTGTTTIAGASINANTILAIGNDSAFSTGAVGITSGITLTAAGGSRNIGNAFTWGASGTIGGSNDLNFSGSFTSSGAAGRTITINNSGLTTLSGNVFLAPDNAAAGGLTINGTGNFTISGVLANNSAANTLAKNLTVNTTAGTLTLSNANTYTGTTTLSAGTLALGNRAAFGNGGTVAWNGVSTSANTSLSGANAIANTGTFGGTNSFTGSNSIELSGSLSQAASRTTTNNLSAGTLTYSGPFALSASAANNTHVFNGSGNTVVSGVISNGGTATTSAITYSGSNKLSLSNTNTYGGATTISGGGTISVGNIGNSGANGNVGAGTTINFGSTTTNGTLLYTGTGETTTKIINLSGTTGGAILDQSGASGLLKFTANLTAPGLVSTDERKTLTLQGSTAGSGEISGIIGDSVLGTAGQLATSVTKAGTGTWTLSGVNTYTGATAVSAGTLLVNGSTAVGSAVTVNSTGTLGGLGTVNGSVTVNNGGTVAPGTSPGILNTGSATFNSGATFSVEIGGTTAGTNYDQLNVTGSVSPNDATLSLVQFGGFVPTAAQTFTIINNDSNDAITTFFSGLAEGATITNFLGSGLNATITYAGGVNGNDVVLTVAAAPETTVAVSGGNLTITDANGGTTDDTLTISLVGGNIQIFDPNHTLSAGAGATQVNPNTVQVPIGTVTFFQIDTLGGNDTLTLDLSGGDFIPSGGLTFNGGTQTSTPGDKLIILGGSQGAVTYNYTNAHDGSVVMANFGAVNYTGLEPISNSGSATDIVFNLPAGGTNAATLGDDGTGGNTMSRLSAASIETTDFANPSGSVSIFAGNATDTMNVNALPDLTAGLSLPAAATRIFTVTFGGAVTLASDKSIAAEASSAITVNGNLTTSGTGTIALNAPDVSGNGNLTTGSGLTVTNTGTSTLSGVIGGGATATLRKEGVGQLILPTANTYAGRTTINGGELSISSDTSLGTAPSSATPEHLILNGAGLLATGSFTLASTRGIGLGPASGSGSGTIAVDNTFTLTYGGIIADSGASTSGLNKIGGGTLILSGSNTYRGSTSIDNGILSINGDTALGQAPSVTTPGHVVVNNGATLQLQGNFTLASTRGIAVGPSTGTGAGIIDVTTGSTVSYGGIIANNGSSTSGVTKTGAGTLEYSSASANTYTGQTTINQGTLNVNGSIISNTLVNSTGTLGGTGTINSANTLTVSGGTVAPGTSPGILNTGSATFNGSSTFAVEIGGTTPGNASTNHDQLNVTGTVSLGNATLSLFSFGGFVPAGGQTFVILNNDAAEAISGTFNGLAEGATITNFLGSSFNATITYAGGVNNNDVVLSVVNACTPPSIVYVDDNFTNPVLGQDPDGGGPATNFGCDSFATIQGGVDGVTSGGTVIVRPGTYPEAVLINKPLSLQGAQVGQNANTRFAAFVTGANGPKADPAVESIITAAATAPASGANDTLHVMASNVSIDGFVVDGNNPALAQGGAAVVGGINTDSRRAIQTEDAAGNPFAANNVTVQNNVIQNFSQRGVELINGTASNTAPATTGNVITANRVRNFGLDGIVLAFNAYADITFNTIDTPAFPTEAGIWVQDFLNTGTPHTTNIANNNITVGDENFGGIWVNLAYLSALNINNNTVNAAAGVTGLSDLTFGIYLSSLRPGTTASLSGNTVGATGGTFSRGISLWNLGASTTTVTGGTVGNSLKGVSLHDNDPNFGLAGSNSAASLSGISISGTTTGVFVDAAGSTGDTVALEISGNSSIANTTTAISVVGANASANVHDNAASIHDNTTGVDVNAGAVTLTSNNLFANTTSLRFTSGASGTAHFNRIISTTTAIDNPNNLTPNLENNWWGCNAGPGNAGCGAVTGAGADFDPRLVLLASANPSTINPGGMSTVSADMTHNSAGAVPTGGTLPNIPDSFSATNGTMNPTSGTIIAGADSSTFTSSNSSSAVVTVTVDNQSVNVPITVNATPSYTWAGTVNSDWQIPLNWTPTRLLPGTSDILFIDGGTTPAPIITNVPTQTIGALHLTGNAQVTLQTSAANTLTVSGASGSDLTVPTGSFLTLDGSNGLTIKVSGAGSIGTISGGVVMQAGFHRLFGDANGDVVFQSGATCATAPNYNATGNPFGTGAAGDGATGSVVFASGSSYFHNAGGSPFGTIGNGPVAVFQTGSNANWLTSSGFQASGRTYANLIIGNASTATNVSDSGSGNFQFDNLTVNSTSSTNSGLSFTGSGASTVTIQGNITSNGAGNGGTLPDVTISAGSGGIVLANVPAGSVVFTVDGSNTRGIDFESNFTVSSGISLALSRKLLLGISQPNGFVATVDGALTGNASGYVIGNEKRSFTGAESFTYHVGTVNGYSPLDANVTAATGSLTALARQGSQPVLNAASSLQRYWTLTEAGSVTADLTFHYLDPTDIAGNEANYRVIVVESGTATSFPNACPSGNFCVDTAANTATARGVNTFSDWTVGEPNAPTAVHLAGFNATRTDNEVVIQWQSGYEARNLGYYVYREQNGKRIQITPSLVAGSALVVGPQTVMNAGLSYTWYDQLAARTGAVQADALNPVTYWVEDVDLDGTRTLHGPIAPSIAYANPKQRATRSELLSEMQRRVPATGTTFSSWPADFADQQKELLTPPQTGSKGNLTQRDIAALPGLKLTVTKTGWYRVTLADMLAAGFNPKDIKDSEPRLELFANGVEVPIKLSGNGILTADTDYLEFYGHGLDSPTDGAQTYYLTVSKYSEGKRIAFSSDGYPGEPSGPLSFDFTIERKDRFIYYPALLNGDGENTFGHIVRPTPVSETLPVSHPSQAGAQARLEVSLVGVTQQAHTVTVSLNGQSVGTVSFSNNDHPTSSFSVPAPLLLDGDNTVQFAALGGDTDVSLVDTMRLTYPHLYQADNNQLAISTNNGRTIRVSGFTDGLVRAVDITNPSNLVEVQPLVDKDDQGLYRADLQVPFASLRRPHTILLFADSSVAHPDAIRSNQPSAWATHTVGSDYVIITTGDLKASVEPLAALRRAQGMVVDVIDVEDLYDEFSFGMHSPQAIRDFLQTATNDWTRKPHFVLLAGDASYDPRNYTGQGITDLVPTKLVDTALLETASDDWLADFDGDGVADLAVGRLPLRTAGAMAAMVAKIINYENMAPDPARGAVLVADGTFESASSSVQSLLPPGMPVQTINRSSADDATIHNQIIASLNQGPKLANYFGHGSNGVWTGASLLSSPDAPALTNQNRLSVFMMMTCFNGYFHDAYHDSLAEALLNSPGGAVAVWASSGMTEPAGQTVVDQELYRQLFGASGQGPALGDAVRAAKHSTNDNDVRRTWILFGDPAMRLR